MTFYQSKRKLNDQKIAPKYVGIHLSGANAHKTSLSVIQGDPLQDTLDIVRVYEKIGSVGKLFSDERMVEIILHESPIREVFIDCPLTVPPCVSCVRPHCPGVLKCEDISVAYMLSLARKIKPNRKKTRRPINPQSQRLWDVLAQTKNLTLDPLSAYSGNLAPLVTRAKTLQRRLNMLEPSIKIRETSVVYTLLALSSYLNISKQALLNFRNFEYGYDSRTEIIAGLVKKNSWLRFLKNDIENQEKLTHSVENFQSLISALAAAFYGHGLTIMPPADFIDEEGWVYIPWLASMLEERKSLRREKVLESSMEMN